MHTEISAIETLSSSYPTHLQNLHQYNLGIFIDTKIKVLRKSWMLDQYNYYQCRGRGSQFAPN